MSSRRPIRDALHLARAFRHTAVPSLFFPSPELPTRTFRSMGTMATVTLGPNYADRIESITEHVHAIFDRLESEMSAYKSDSAVTRLATNAGVAPVAVSEDTLRVLNLAQHFGTVSAGAFDITACPLVSLWGFNGAKAPAVLPSEQSIREIHKLVDYRRLVLHDRTALLPVKGMAVDVGGIAKGYAVDRAYDYCLSLGIRDFLIDFSGNLRVAGRPSRRGIWQIGIRDPFDPSRLIGKIALQSGLAIATSGSYERYVEIAGNRFSHVIDPRTGYPITGTASVSVLCENAIAADALSTAFFVTGLMGAGEILKKLPAVELLLVPDRFPTNLWLTPGLDKVLTTPPNECRSFLHY